GLNSMTASFGSPRRRPLGLPVQPSFVCFGPVLFVSASTLAGKSPPSQLVVIAALVLLILGSVPLISPAWGAQPRRDMSHPDARSIGSFACSAVSCVSASYRPGLRASTWPYDGAARSTRIAPGPTPS